MLEVNGYCEQNEVEEGFLEWCPGLNRVTLGLARTHI